MLCSHTRERLQLHSLGTLLVVFLFLEDTIVAMVVLNPNTSNVIQPLFKPFLAHNSLTGAKRYLIFNPDEPRSGIIVDCPTIKTFTATTIATGKPPRSLTNKLIRGNKLPNSQFVTTESSLSFEIQLNLFDVWRSLSSPSQLTGLALRNCTRRCRGKLGFNNRWVNL